MDSVATQVVVTNCPQLRHFWFIKRAFTLVKAKVHRFHIDYAQKKVYDMTELNHFCCVDCAIASQIYRSTLSEELNLGPPSPAVSF